MRRRTINKLPNASLPLRVNAVDRLRPEWLRPPYVAYSILIELYHGSTLLGKTMTNHFLPHVDRSLKPQLEIDGFPLGSLPRESRLTFTLIGRTPSDEITEEFYGEELGWTSIQCFDSKGKLNGGKHTLPFWHSNWIYKSHGPVPDPSMIHDPDNDTSSISIELNLHGQDICFPEIIPSTTSESFREPSFATETSNFLEELVQDIPISSLTPGERKLIWENRDHLRKIPNALPKVLLSAGKWDCEGLGEIYGLLNNWSLMEPIQALQLLLPCFPDCKVREQAVSWISGMDNDELVNILPQLVEALSYETYNDSALARFLLGISIGSSEVSNSLFWILASQVRQDKWEQEDYHLDPFEVSPIFDPKRRRLELFLNSLMDSCGPQWKSTMMADNKLLKMLSSIATKVKGVSYFTANRLLKQELQQIEILHLTNLNSLALPLSPPQNVIGIDVGSSHVFSSATFPMKITFINEDREKGNIPIIFKKGDDLRQDMLAMSIIRAMNKCWLNEGSDFQVVTYTCVATGDHEGVLEIVPECETLLKIEAGHRPPGPFGDSFMADWLGKMNPDPEDYKRAVENFTSTSAAYSVITYVLGISDRHKDNIMLTTGGHLFHIDYGKRADDGQKIGLFKKDKIPFVLTSEMVYVMTDGKRSPQKFTRFVELCCEAFRIVRRNGNALVNLVGMMTTAGIPGVDGSSINFVQNRLLPGCPDEEASRRFTMLIKKALRNSFSEADINVLFKSQDQVQQHGEEDQANPGIMSPVLSTPSAEGEPHIVYATITGFMKIYRPPKYYSYLIEVTREGVQEPFKLNRTYEEFLELYRSLCVTFPQNRRDLKKLSEKSIVERRLNSAQLAEKRKLRLQKFLDSLFHAPVELSRSELVRRFFRPLDGVEDGMNNAEDNDNLNLHGHYDEGYSSHQRHQVNPGEFEYYDTGNSRWYVPLDE